MVSSYRTIYLYILYMKFLFLPQIKPDCTFSAYELWISKFIYEDLFLVYVREIRLIKDITSRIRCSDWRYPRDNF